MHLSDKGLLEIAEHEGIVPAPYLDSRGNWTFGIGHTAAAGGLAPQQMPRGMPQNLEAGISLALSTFRKDVAGYEARVTKAIKVPLEQHQFDALVSFDFNTGGITRAKLTEAINFGVPNASEHFFGWLKPPEIRGRRTDEKRLFDTGDYQANGDAIAVWSVNSEGQLHKIMKTIHGDELLSRMGPREKPAPSIDYEKYLDGSFISTDIHPAQVKLDAIRAILKSN